MDRRKERKLLNQWKKSEKKLEKKVRNRMKELIKDKDFLKNLDGEMQELKTAIDVKNYIETAQKRSQEENK